MPSHWPKISLVTPCFRHAHFLEATIESVLSQGYPNLEYVIVDGGSDDGTIDVIRKYEKYLHWWCSESDNGHYDAVNKGFRHTTGQIMGWINSDDIHLPWTLRTVGSIFAELSDVLWISSLEQTRIDYQGYCLGSERISGFSREAFLDGCYVARADRRGWFLGCIQQESTFWQRSLWDAVGGGIRTEYSLAGDFDLWARFYRHAELYGTVSPLAGFRLSQQQRSSQAVAYRGQAIASLASAAGSGGRAESCHPQDAWTFRGRLWGPSKRTFRGYRIIRERRDQADGFWAIEGHRFHCRLARRA